MTHSQALQKVDAILNAENTTWQEKKNRIADLMVDISNRNLDKS